MTRLTTQAHVSQDRAQRATENEKQGQLRDQRCDYSGGFQESTGEDQQDSGMTDISGTSRTKEWLKPAE